MTPRHRPAPTPGTCVVAGFACSLVTSCTTAARVEHVHPPLARVPRVEVHEIDHPLTLSEVVALTLARNPDREAARARFEGACAALDRAEAALWPVVGASASYVRSDAPSSYLFKHIDGHGLPAGASFDDPGWFGATELALSARWNIWNAGRDARAIEAASHDVEASAAEEHAVDNALAAAAVSALVDARAARELGAAAQSSIAAVAAQLAEVRTRLERGAALRSDVLSLEVRLAEARQRVLSSNLGEQLAHAALRRLTSLRPTDRLELAETIHSPTHEPATLEAAIDEACARRPELAVAREALAGARARTDAAERAWLPRLDLEARAWGDDLHSGIDFDDPNYQLGVSLSFDFLDGGARSAGVRQARSLVHALESSGASQVRAVEFDVQQAWLQLDEARTRLEVTSAALAASEETLDLVGKQFAAGSVVVTRFLEAEAARTQARSSAVRARLDVERARLELARARGALVEELSAGARER